MNSLSGAPIRQVGGRAKDRELRARSAAWISRAMATGVPGSSSPTMTRAGHEISLSRSVTLIFRKRVAAPDVAGGGRASDETGRSSP